MKADRLVYRRQFLLASSPVETLSAWRCTTVGSDTPEAYVYSHPDLECTSVETGSATIVLLGYLFDPARPERSNGEILHDIASVADSFEKLVRALKQYTGRYVFVYRDGETLNVIHDALAIREVYYCTTPNRILCGSQPNLIQEYSEPRITTTEDPHVIEFYEKEMKAVRNGRLWVGDETFFQGVRHLLPNHYLNARTRSAVRYWPAEKLEPLEPREAVRRACSFLQGAMRAVTNRHPIMMAVTSGTDSRTLLAASRDVKDGVYYFINKEPHLSDEHPDIRIPKAMFERIGLPFHIHEVDGRVDEGFREIFLKNTFLSNDHILSTIYNVYFLSHGDKMNVLGVGEIGRSYYGEAARPIDGYYLARSLKYRNSSYAVDQCRKWLDETCPVAERTGIDILTLFLWEQLLGNWGAVGNSESDIAIEEFDPFNSHFMYETMLAIDGKTARRRGDGTLFKEMIRHMWPELMEFPINPPHTVRDRMKAFLNRIGVERYIRNLLYRLEEVSFQRNVKHVKQ